MDWSLYDAALFDLDGVITPTAEVHMRAWKTMFTEFFEAEGIGPPYTDEDYFAYVDGKPRYDGVASLLASRHVTLPAGSPSDPPDTRSIAGLGNRKNDLVTELLQTEGVRAYPGSVRLLDALARLPVRAAVVSSSRNAPVVLEAAGLSDRFDIVVDGAVAAGNSLPGKPAPDTFVFAAQHLGVPVDKAVVFEDAISGVAAGRAGSFGLVVGVDRGAGAEALTAAGADLVVKDLDEVLPT